MKKILITGANSYIGTRFDAYVSQWPDAYQVDTVDTMGDQWLQMDFGGYDAVFHVAGIAHIKETAENAHLYYEVNRDLAIGIAKKAKADKVPHFVFLSSMSVYGIDEGVITFETEPMPKSNYGKSKLEAEQGMLPLADDSFTVSVLRPPMVYGEGCKGNYQALVKFAKYFPVFPAYKNKRSVIHIDKLSAYVKWIIDECAGGLHLPQDDTYVCTSEMVRSIASDMGKKMRLLKIFNPSVFLLVKFTTLGRKAFGNLYYDK